MWIFSTAVICNGQKQHGALWAAQLQLPFWELSVGFAVMVWKITCQEAEVVEALQYDLANPCVVQLGMLWISASTRLNCEYLGEGLILEIHNIVVNLALVAIISTFLEDAHPENLFLGDQ